MKSNLSSYSKGFTLEFVSIHFTFEYIRKLYEMLPTSTSNIQNIRIIYLLPASQSASAVISRKNLTISFCNWVIVLRVICTIFTTGQLQPKCIDRPLDDLCYNPSQRHLQVQVLIQIIVLLILQETRR